MVVCAACVRDTACQEQAHFGGPGRLCVNNVQHEGECALFFGTSFICTLFSNLKVRVGVHTQVRPYASKPLRQYEPPAFFLSGHSSLSSSITGIENHWPLAETLLISTPSPPALRYTGKREQQNGLEDQRRREASTSKTTAHKISPNKG